MRKKLLIMVLFVSILLVFLIKPAFSTNESIEIDLVNRTIHITYSKIIRVTDEYTFINTGNDPLSSIIIEVPYEYSSNIAFFELLGIDSEKLTFEKLPYDGSNFIKWRVYLDSPLTSGDTVSMKNIMNFIGLTSDYGDEIDGSKGHINFNILKYPSAPYYIRNCSVIINCDPRVSVYDPNQNIYYSNFLIASQISIDKNNITTYSSRYNLTEPTGYGDFALSAVKFPSIKRVIRIDSWGYMYISEEHLIENFGPYGNFGISGGKSYNKFTFNVPLDAENIYVFDKFGRLDFSVWGENTKNVSINFESTRYSLARGENTLYWITYRIPLFDYTQRTGDKMKLNLDILFGKFHCLVENFDITLILPKGASLNNIFPSVDSILTKDNSLNLIFNESDVTSYNYKLIELEIDLSKSYFYFLSRPFIFLLIFGIICTSYVISKRVLPLKAGLPTRITVVPTPILIEFCSLFEEKVSLITEIEKLDEDLKRRKIKKRIYRNQRKTAERKIFELDRDIDELKITLRAAGGRFAQIVNELEINEAERQSSKDGLHNLEQRYFRKKISVVAYQKLRKDLLNRHKRSKTKIDKLIFEIREILS